LLREASRLLLREAAADWDLVLVARPEVLSESYATRIENLTRLFRGADVLCERVASPT
jgi:RNase P protein component